MGLNGRSDYRRKAHEVLYDLYMHVWKMWMVILTLLTERNFQFNFDYKKEKVHSVAKWLSRMFLLNLLSEVKI